MLSFCAVTPSLQEHSSRVISPHLGRSYFVCTECGEATQFAVASTSRNKVRRAVLPLIGHSHSKLGRYTVHSLP